MKPVERYRATLDEIKAPDTLNAKLLAIPAQYGEAAQDETQPAANVATATAHAAEATTAQTIQATAEATANADGAQGKKGIHFPAFPKNWKKQALAAAACFAIGMLATDALDLQIMSKIGSNGMDFATFDTTMTSGSTSSSTSATNSTTIMMQESAFDGSASLSDTTVDISDSTRTITDDTSATTAADTSRKIIYTTSISLETLAYDDTLAALSTAVNEAGGYLEYSEQYASVNNTSERSAYFIYRIPAEHYSSFLAGVGEAGSITYQNESANDVTSTYLDLEARITTLTQQRDRLWELQAEAESLSDLLEIETTLTNVLYQIESYQSQLNYLADQVDYATVSIYLDEVIEYTITEPTVWETITRTATSALTSFIATIGNLLLTILSLWVWISLALIGVFVYHGMKHKKAKQDN